MINPTWINKLIGMLLGSSLLGLAISVMTFLRSGNLIDTYLDRKLIDPILTLQTLVYSILLIMIVCYIWNYYLYKEREQHRNTRQRLEAALFQRKELDLLRFVDVITRVPNQLQWKDDIRSIQKELEDGVNYQCILIDLDGFKAINDKFGFERGDAVILHFAQTIYHTMRRNEKIYKRPFGDGDLTKRWTRFYRKYPGGDEFIFLLRGKEDEALGFLVRLHRLTVGPIKSEINALLGAEVAFDFHGAICPILPKDTAASALTRLCECFYMVKKRRTSRVYWFSDQRSEEFDQPEHRTLRRAYQDAEAEFALPQGGIRGAS